MCFSTLIITVHNQLLVLSSRFFSHMNSLIFFTGGSFAPGFILLPVVVALFLRGIIENNGSSSPLSLSSRQDHIHAAID
ncbi:MAG: hypothetical protein GY820_40435 [Gammaproteobacteria bacterium]|nr:hypothetical protein [Gammaproteobacteria bacterium]